MEFVSQIEGVIDGHAHPCVDRQAVSVDDLAASFSETDYATQLREHAPSTVTMQAGVRFLAQRLGVAPTADTIVKYRNEHGLSKYAQRLIAQERIACILLDTGYPQHGLTVTESEKVLGVECKEVVRVESVAESLISTASSAGDLLDELEEALRRVDVGRVVAFKTIASYRCGLDLAPPTANELRVSFESWKRQFNKSGNVRIVSRALISAVIERALLVARDLQLPLQIHTGFGDRDLSLPKSNPWHLQQLFEDKRFEQVSFVLLHCAYPFVREAAILAALFPNVFVDISLAVPLAAHGCTAVILELFEQSPMTKILYGSDASVGPELIAWGAEVGKIAVESALRSLVENNWLTSDQAVAAPVSYSPTMPSGSTEFRSIVIGELRVKQQARCNCRRTRGSTFACSGGTPAV